MECHEPLVVWIGQVVSGWLNPTGSFRVLPSAEELLGDFASLLGVLWLVAPGSEIGHFKATLGLGICGERGHGTGPVGSAIFFKYYPSFLFFPFIII